jgi:methylthioribose-1-phosphate isomerase
MESDCNRYPWAVRPAAEGRIAIVPPPLRWSEDPEHGPAVILLDQRRLPSAEVELVCTHPDELVAAIRALAVRGAPLLGIAGGYGVALAAARGLDVPAAARSLAEARPTAVNLGRGVARVLAAGVVSESTERGTRQGDKRATSIDPVATLAAARALHAEEDAASAAMAAHGLTLVPGGARILTHCNTGALAVGGTGSAFAVVLAAHRAGRLRRLWVDETRPLLQGARLTAWEAATHGVPHTVLPDCAAPALMAAGQVDLVVVGADRIAADGSVANKIGTYGLAVAAAHHDIPFVVVAPRTTLDPDTADGASIVIEQRDASEVTTLAGRQIAPEGSAAFNPAFDVTPPELVTALVTEVGVVHSPRADSLAGLLGH